MTENKVLVKKSTKPSTININKMKQEQKKAQQKKVFPYFYYILLNFQFTTSIRYKKKNDTYIGKQTKVKREQTLAFNITVYYLSHFNYFKELKKNMGKELKDLEMIVKKHKRAQVKKKQ